jgi:TonB family protein
MKILSILLLFFVLNLHSQNSSDAVSELRKNALAISNLEDLDQSIYEEIKNYDVILVGEMHGTQEPAKFVYGLLNLISKNEGQVVLVLEAPLKSIGCSVPVSQYCLDDSDFFTSENIDGRNGKAWYDLLRMGGNLRGVNIGCFDNQRVSPSDSSMYLDFVDFRKGIDDHYKYRKVKIVSLSGNIHNSLKPHRNKATLGSYLLNDTINFKPERIMSINHWYKEGTMMNNSGNGLELKTVEGKDNFLNQTISSKMYLCKSLLESQKNYTHFLFTEKVTHSEKLNLKKELKMGAVTLDKSLDGSLVQPEMESTIPPPPPPPPMEIKIDNPEKIYDFVAQRPEFPNGITALDDYFKMNLKYPALAKENGIEGRVIVKFVVKSDGTVANPIIVRGIRGGCDEEAIRLVKSMPKWIPGKQNDKPVNVYYTHSVNFRIN